MRVILGKKAVFKVPPLVFQGFLVKTIEKQQQMPLLAALGRSWEAVGDFLATFGSSWPLWMQPWDTLGSSWGAPGCSWVALGRLLASSWRPLGPPGPLLGPAGLLRDRS